MTLLFCCFDIGLERLVAVAEGRVVKELLLLLFSEVIVGGI